MDIFKSQIMDNPKLPRCRTCLEQGCKLIPFSVMSTASKNTLHMSDIFMTCASIQIAPNDGFSQYACSDCVISAEKAYLFKKQCEQSDKVWNEFSKQLKEKSVQVTTPMNLCEIDHVTNDAEMSEAEFVEIDPDIKSIEIYEEVKNEQFTCRLCFTIFLDEAKLSRHELAHTIEPKELAIKEHAIYHCRKCSVNFETAEDFIEHCQKLHDNSTEKPCYNCKLCAGEFDDLIEFTTHISKTHGNLKSKQLAIWPQSCAYCPLTLKSRNEKTAHLNREHSDLKTFSCRKCGKTFFQKVHLSKHEAWHNPKFVEVDSDIKSIEIHNDIGYEQFTCKHCLTIFLDEAKLSRHELAHTIEPKKSLVKELVIYGCRECSIDAKTAEDFVEHCHNLHENSIKKPYYRCKLCERNFAKLSQLSTHVSKTHTPHRSSHGSRFECKICHQKYKTIDTLHYHQKALHSKIKLLPLSQYTWPRPCNYCEVSLNSHMERLTHHEQEHGDLKSFSCNKCGKTFLHKKLLLQHALCHEDAKKYMCQYCGKGFNKSYNLTVHIRIHTGERPYKCDKCDATFLQWTALHTHRVCHVEERNFECKECHKKLKSRNALRGHMKTHTDGPKYSCHLCLKQLKTSYGLKLHLLTHSNNRSFVCEVCGKRFNVKGGLKIHMVTHTGKKPYICLICNKGYTQSHHLRSHNAKFHKNDTAL